MTVLLVDNFDKVCNGCFGILREEGHFPLVNINAVATLVRLIFSLSG